MLFYKSLNLIKVLFIRSISVQESRFNSLLHIYLQIPKEIEISFTVSVQIFLHTYNKMYICDKFHISDIKFLNIKCILHKEKNRDLTERSILITKLLLEIVTPNDPLLLTTAGATIRILNFPKSQ